MDKDIELPLLKENENSQKSFSKSQKVNSHFSEFLNPYPSPNKFERFTSLSSIFRYLSFIDMFSLSESINKTEGAPNYESLPLPYENFNIENMVYQIDREFHEKTKKSEDSLQKDCLRHTCDKTFKKGFIYTLLFTFFYITFHLAGSILLGKIMGIVTFVSLGQDTDEEIAITYAAAFGVLYFLSFVCENWWSYISHTLGASIRLSLTGFIYKKLNVVALSSLQEINIGKVINLLANDLNDFDSGPCFWAPMLLAPYSVSLSCYFMWTHFGIYSLVSMATQILIMISANYLSVLSEGPRNEKNTATDQRIKHTNELIENIRLIKLYAWEKPFRKIIANIRDKEVVALKKLGRIDAIARTFSEISIYMSILIMCICYVMSGGILTTEKVYTSMMILSFAQFWIILCFHLGRMLMVSCKLTIQRLEDVLKVKEVISIQETSKKYLETLNSKNLLSEAKGCVSYKDYTAFWNQSSQNPCLKDITISIPKGQLVAIVGKIGSGKTTFLLSFLREIPITSGQLSFNGSLAYVEQEPVIFSGSIRDNILFGQDFEESFYSRVLRACNLDEDLRQFDHGDQTIVGERGVTLSGGQKARVSLARALYSRSDIYLLDDPLSAVDSRVGRIIFERAIKEILRDKTVLLVTHHLNYAKESERVIVLKDGSIEAEGTFEDLLVQKLDLFENFVKNDEKFEKQEDKRSISIPNVSDRKSYLFSDRKSSSIVNENIYLNEQKQAIINEESTTVSRATYLTYLKESQNYSFALCVVGTVALAQIIAIFLTKYIGYWAQLHNEANFYSPQNNSEEQPIKFDHNQYIIGIVVLIVVISALQFVKVSFTIKFLLDTNTKLHQKMLYKISRTFVSFFYTTPIGTTLNRFSNDLGVLDKANWAVVYDFCTLMCGLIFPVVYLCFINIGIAIPCLIAFVCLYWVKMHFSKPLLELRKFELISKSPIFSEISSTLNGLLIIRVYKQGHRFLRNFLDLIYKNSQAFLLYSRGTRAFSISLEACLYFLCIFGISFFIYVAYFSNIAAGAFGLALFYLISIANDSTWAIRQTIYLDINMQSAQRIQQYCILPEEAPANVPNADNRLLVHLKSGRWPFEGHLSFKNVYLRYPNTNSYALNGLSFSVEPNCKVGIVGRTGAGKSSVIQALFRIVEIEDLKESSIEIDGVDTRTLGLETLRGSLSILPQTPVIFSGSIRRNLDPFGELEDNILWEALEKVELKSYVQSLEKGLDTDMSISSSVFSTGQKQLVCLARVILRKSKIVILDEATANVDMNTDHIIQEKITEIFEGCVVLTIAHRLITIAHYDKVLVLDKGRLVEYDHPYKLLVQTIGDTEITQEGIFANMVKKSGEKISKEVFNKAYSSFNKMKF